MADNYLEKKMEEHRAGGRPAYRPKLTPRGTRPGEYLVKFHPCPVMVEGNEASSAELSAILGELAGAGFKVDFTFPNPVAGARLAQMSGARYLPPEAGMPLEAAMPPESAKNPRPGTPRICVKISATEGETHARLQAGDATFEIHGTDPSLAHIVTVAAAIMANRHPFAEIPLEKIAAEGHSF